MNGQECASEEGGRAEIGEVGKRMVASGGSVGLRRRARLQAQEWETLRLWNRRGVRIDGIDRVHRSLSMCRCCMKRSTLEVALFDLRPFDIELTVY